VGGRPAFAESKRAGPPLRLLFPVVVVVATVLAYALKRRERQQWERRKISGGRKALVLNLLDRR